MTETQAGTGPWRSVLSAGCAVLVGVGLGRFAYTPLLPAIIGAGWFAPPDAISFGVANLAGYVLGALCGRTLARHLPFAWVLRVAMLVVAASFWACAAPAAPAWFLAWRFAAGVAGAVLMVLAAPAVLPLIAPARRGLASGLIFLGIGLGILLCGTLVPLLLRLGLTQTWLGLATLMLVLTVVAWGGWPTAPPIATTAPAGDARRSLILPAILVALFAEYALNAAASVPHMIFVVDFVARALERGMAAGALQWMMFGIGALAGPVVAGILADRIGFRASLRLLLALQAIAAFLPAQLTGTTALAVSSIVNGAATPGCPPLVLGRINEVAAPERRRSAWSIATVCFALGSWLSAYVDGRVYAQSGSYTWVYALGGMAAALGLVIDLIAGRAR